MSLRGRVFDVASNSLIRASRLNAANKLTCRFLERIFPLYDLEHDGCQYRFYCPNRIALWRVETFFTKEPETIEWIDTFKAGDVLFDVGAKIGLYSIYAAKKGVSVVAFEPESQNYALLNRNVFLNQAWDQICCLNVALSDKNGIDFLYLPRLEAGGALNNFGEALDWRKKPFDASFKQAAVAYTLDSFLLCFPDPFPQHIKIDVDGLEAKIVKGSEKTLREERVKSLSIEINDRLTEDQEAVKFIQSLGMKLLHKRHSPMFDGGEFKDVYNYLFVR